MAGTPLGRAPPATRGRAGRRRSGRRPPRATRARRRRRAAAGPPGPRRAAPRRSRRRGCGPSRGGAGSRSSRSPTTSYELARRSATIAAERSCTQAWCRAGSTNDSRGRASRRAPRGRTSPFTWRVSSGAPLGPGQPLVDPPQQLGLDQAEGVVGPLGLGVETGHVDPEDRGGAQPQLLARRAGRRYDDEVGALVGEAGGPELEDRGHVLVAPELLVVLVAAHGGEEAAVGLPGAHLDPLLPRRGQHPPEVAGRDDDVDLVRGVREVVERSPRRLGGGVGEVLVGEQHVAGPVAAPPRRGAARRRARGRRASRRRRSCP